MSEKEIVIEWIRALPDDATAAEIVGGLKARFDATNGEDDEELTQEEWEAYWIQELERRLADFKANPSQGIPAEVFMERMREKYG